MKKFSIIIGLACIVMLSFSCNKTLQSLFTGFDVKVPDMQVTIPAIPIVTANEILLGSFSLNFNLDSTIRANTNNVFNINSVTSLKISNLLVTISNGTSLNNLSNFESGRLLISSNSNTTEATLVNFMFPTIDTYSYVADTNNAPEILSYYRGTQINYKLFGKLRKPTTSALNLTLSITIRVK